VVSERGGRSQKVATRSRESEHFLERIWPESGEIAPVALLGEEGVGRSSTTGFQRLVGSLGNHPQSLNSVVSNDRAK